MTRSEDYLNAKKRVEAKLSFYIHAAIFCAVNAVLIIINLSSTTDKIWFIWPLLGWGIGLALHAALVFTGKRQWSLKEKMIQDELENSKK